MLLRHPGIPHSVYLIEIANVIQPHLDVEDPMLIGPGLSEKMVDFLKNFTHLLGGGLPRPSYLASQIDRSVVDHPVMDARVKVKPLDVAHVCHLSIAAVSRIGFPWRYCA